MTISAYIPLRDPSTEKEKSSIWLYSVHSSVKCNLVTVNGVRLQEFKKSHSPSGSYSRKRKLLVKHNLLNNLMNKLCNQKKKKKHYLEAYSQFALNKLSKLDRRNMREWVA